MTMHDGGSASRMQPRLRNGGRGLPLSSINCSINCESRSVDHCLPACSGEPSEASGAYR